MRSKEEIRHALIDKKWPVEKNSHSKIRNRLAKISSWGIEDEAMEEYANEQKKPLIEALQKIGNWELPDTGRFWPSGGKVSYEAEYGSNGVRDYFRKLAIDALINELNK